MTGLGTDVFCDIGMRLGDERAHSWKNTCQTELEQVVDVTVGSEIRDYVKIITQKKNPPRESVWTSTYRLALWVILKQFNTKKLK